MTARFARQVDGRGQSKIIVVLEYCLDFHWQGATVNLNPSSRLFAHLVELAQPLVWHHLNNNIYNNLKVWVLCGVCTNCLTPCELRFAMGLYWQIAVMFPNVSLTCVHLVFPQDEWSWQPKGTAAWELKKSLPNTCAHLWTVLSLCSNESLSSIGLSWRGWWMSRQRTEEGPGLLPAYQGQNLDFTGKSGSELSEKGGELWCLGIASW